MKRITWTWTIAVALGVVMVHPVAAQEPTFDKDRYLEFTTELQASKDNLYLAVDRAAWVDFNANAQVDEGEVFEPKEDGMIELFNPVYEGGKTLRIYGDFAEVSLRKNKITSVDVHRMTQLTYLELAINDLTSVDVTALTKLEGLNLRENDLTSIDVSNQSKLGVLEVIYNRIESLDLANKPDMYMLGIAHNRFSEQSIERILGDLPKRDRELYGEVFAHFPLDTEQNVITRDQVLRFKEKMWTVYTWSISANNWIPYAGVLGVEEITASLPFRADYHDGNLIICGSQPDAEIIIYDLSGLRLVSFLGDAETTLYRHRLADGIYIVRQGLHTAKLIVTNNK